MYRDYDVSGTHYAQIDYDILHEYIHWEHTTDGDIMEHALNRIMEYWSKPGIKGTGHSGKTLISILIRRLIRQDTHNPDATTRARAVLDLMANNRGGMKKINKVITEKLQKK